LTKFYNITKIEISLLATKKGERTRIKNMLNKKIWLSSCFILTFLLNITEVNAKINYSTLHNNHEIIAKYESGKKGYEAVSKDCYGGHSYGKWQISTKRSKKNLSTFDAFLRYSKTRSPDIYKKLIMAGGYEGAYNGTMLFVTTWKSLACKQDFIKLYDDFILNTQIIPVYIRLDKSNNIKLNTIASWSEKDEAMQASINSAIIQHGIGGAYNIICNVIAKYDPKSKEEFIANIYEYRKIKYPKYKKRYTMEFNDLKNYYKINIL
jgi:hypothetical protein